MRIAFDAKRAYQNHTGLGNYSRLLIQSVAQAFPQNEYYLMAPKQTDMFDTSGLPNTHTILPSGFYKSFRSFWRSSGVKKDLTRLKIDLYHGLSNEIPASIHQTEIKSVVTIHDLIFERYPEQYNKIDTAIYRKKFRYAAEHADKVIAISKQTKDDIIQFYNIPENKIEICYQGCNPIFEKEVSQAERQRIKIKYNLPEKYFLYVGSVIERKNLLTICKGLNELRNTLQIPLVVIGTGGEYMNTVKEYITKHNLSTQVIFLSENPVANTDNDFKTAADFPAIYQSALAMIYPSIFEGFGIPVLEALWSKIPVITSNLSCMPETGGDAAYYINPLSTDEMASALGKVATDEILRKQMITKGIVHAHHFNPANLAKKMMQVYQSVL
ncbi:MAG: glycosyltransferase family 4 protein [Bacteroidetes bacterium]|nr:glycosyltransferase family 4 protein [Bacteroidota bacterium]